MGMQKYKNTWFDVLHSMQFRVSFDVIAALHKTIIWAAKQKVKFFLVQRITIMNHIVKN